MYFKTKLPKKKIMLGSVTGPVIQTNVRLSFQDDLRCWGLLHWAHWKYGNSEGTQGWLQKYSRLRCSLHVKGLVICFYLGWSGSILQFRQNIIKVGWKSWLLTCSSNITLSLPSYTGSALKRELNFCNGYLSLLYFWW